jgi:hypothetical protein
MLPWICEKAHWARIPPTELLLFAHPALEHNQDRLVSDTVLHDFLKPVFGSRIEMLSSLVVSSFQFFGISRTVQVIRTAVCGLLRRSFAAIFSLEKKIVHMQQDTYIRSFY